MLYEDAKDCHSRIMCECDFFFSGYLIKDIAVNNKTDISENAEEEKVEGELLSNEPAIEENTNESNTDKLADISASKSVEQKNEVESNKQYIDIDEREYYREVDKDRSSYYKQTLKIGGEEIVSLQSDL